MSNIKASWALELWCDCPSCNEYVNLLDYDDFWSGRELDAVEHGSERSTDVCVVCPTCKHDFKVDLEH